MPAQDRVRRDQALAAQCSGQPPDEGGEDRWVSPVQVWSWQLMIAAFLAVMFAQVGFLGHDARASAGVPFRAPQQRAGPAVREPSHARRSYSSYSPYH
jgi:hypothetical protein